MLFVGSHPHLQAQQMTTQAPPPGKAPQGTSALPLPDDPSQGVYPAAAPFVSDAGEETVTIESDDPQTYQDGIYTLDRNVVIVWGERRVQADHIVYDSNTGDVTATGHLQLTQNGHNDERMQASHGTFNLKTQTGRFFDVTGSVGIKLAKSTLHPVYSNGNPFLFTGRMVVKTGPRNYEIYDGTVTSCQLPKPDWQLSGAHFSIDDDKARGRNSTFRLLNVPVLFLPYVTHPADADERQSGLLIPTFGESSTKGIVIGEEVYVVLNRSADLTVGTEYYSSIGFAENATFHFRGPGTDFATAHYSQVLDRRPAAENQGGEEVLLAGRYNLTDRTRMATNIDYLSSYTYREAFSDSFNLAVTSDIVSTAYVSHVSDGLELGLLADRYQGIKLIAQGTTPQQQVRIFHVPTFSFFSTDHPLGSTGLQLALDATASGLKRSQPGLVTGGVIERFDLHPQASYPITLAQWHFLPAIAGRETIYSRSRQLGAPAQTASESEADLNRLDFEFSFGIRPPVLERTFQPRHLQRLLGTEFRHTIEPEITYRLVDGVDNFARTLRFDATDVVSNTDEVEYGVMQRIYRRGSNLKAANGKPCQTEVVEKEPGFGADEDENDDLPLAAVPYAGGCANEEFISWRLAQKYFFDETFGGAVVNGRRNIFTTTLDLSGVAFLTEPRAISPLISRLRVRSSAHTDFEWDFDYDTGANKFTGNNVYLDVHQGNAFTAVSYARLDAPGRFFTQSSTPTATGGTTGVTSAISDFNQLRFLAGSGSPTKAGLSLAGNVGLDLKHFYGATTQNSNVAGALIPTTTVYPPLLQYASLQGAYNWNCCGLTVEYRKFELGSVRNEGTYRFNFTLANIGAAGNLRRAERLF